MAGTLKRIQDLFRKGEVVVLTQTDPITGELVKIPVYVAKLNALEKDEALKDGRQARALRMIAFDKDINEQAQMDVMLLDLTDAEIVADLLRRKAGELFLKADDEVRADVKWKERLEAIDRGAIAAEGNASQAERDVLAEIALDYEKAVGDLQAKIAREEFRDLTAKPREELNKTYRAAWRDMLGSTSFFEAKRQSEVWYALRECEVTLDADDWPVLDTLRVAGRICATRAEVNNLPDEVVIRVISSLDGEMTSREAGNSGAPSASSGSSEPQSVEADSAPSTPTET